MLLRMQAKGHTITVATASNQFARCEVMWRQRAWAGVAVDLYSGDWIPGFGNYPATYRTSTHEAAGNLCVLEYRQLPTNFVYSAIFTRSGEWRPRSVDLVEMMGQR